MRRKVVWILFTRRVVAMAIFLLGMAGGALSLLRFNPTLAVTGSRLSWPVRFLLDMVEFIRHGI